jgi:PPOX class probable F420-dependent enzyme
MVELSPGTVALLEAPLLAHLATFNSDGTIQVTPLWVHAEDGYVVINTAAGRVKDRNLLRDPRCTIELTSAEDDEQYAEIRGRAERRETEGAEEHADELAHKYVGEPFPSTPGEQRVKWYIAPERVLGPAAKR